MNKISIFCASIIAACSMASCGEDTDPQLQKPTEFTLNTPALASQFYQLTEGGTIDLTCTQPDYGASVITTYQVEVSLDEGFQSVAQNVDGSGDAPAYVTVPGTYKTAKMQISEDMLARSISKLRGIQTIDEYDMINTVFQGPVYIRLVAQVMNEEYTRITSNVIALQNVRSYRAVLEAGRIYMVGDACIAGWNVDPTNTVCPLIETEIGNSLYVGYYELTTGGYFRFYTALTGDWDTNTYGPGADGTNIEVAATPFSGAFLEGKGNWVCTWSGGMTKITVDFGSMKVTFEEAGDEDAAAWREANKLNEE